MHLNALTQSQAASLLGVTTRSLRDWHDAPRNQDGSYPGPALVAWYVAKMTGTGEFDDQRQRLAAAQAEKYETENALRRGQIAWMPDVKRAVTDMIANARAKALSMPTKLSARLVNIGDASIIAAAIRAEVHALLGELAEYAPDGGPDRGGAGVEPDVDAPARVNGKRVGRPRKAA